MKTASDLRAEAARMREFALGVTDVEVLEEIQAMIAELDRRARATGASFVGAMFQVGSTFGSGFTVLNSRARASAGRKLAYRPHMMAMW
jgi:hypothetical protein